MTSAMSPVCFLLVDDLEENLLSLEAPLRRDGLVAFPEDLKVEVRKANRSLLAARSIGDLVAWSGGLYDPPAKFRDW